MPYIVGIAGGTCSGKSTSAERLEQRLADLKVVSIHMDKYFRQPFSTTVAPITRKTYVEHNHPDVLELDRMYADFDEACASDADVVIIEGLFALHLDKIREKLNLKVFVDLKSDERIVRRIKRFMSFGQTMDEVTDRYLDTVRFRHDELIEPTRWHADLVLNGTLDMNKGVDLLETVVRAKV